MKNKFKSLLSAIILIPVMLGLISCKNSSANTFTVTFYNGNAVIDTITADENINITAITAPNVTGYEFDNWYTSANFETLFNFSAPIIGNTGIYAKYNPISVNVRPIYYDFFGSAVSGSDFSMNFDENVNLIPERPNAVYNTYVHTLTELDTSTLSAFDDAFSEFVLYTDHTDENFVEHDSNYYFINEFGVAMSYDYYVKDGYDLVTARHTKYVSVEGSNINHPLYDILYLVKDGQVVNDMIWGIYTDYYIEDDQFYECESVNFIALLDYESDVVTYNFFEYSKDSAVFTKLDEDALNCSYDGNLFVTVCEKPAQNYYCIYEDDTYIYEYITAGDATTLNIDAIKYYYSESDDSKIDLNIINNAPTTEEILLEAQEHSGSLRDFTIGEYEIVCYFNENVFEAYAIYTCVEIEEDFNTYVVNYCIEFYESEFNIYVYIQVGENEYGFDFIDGKIYEYNYNGFQELLPADKIFTQGMLEKYSVGEDCICGILSE